MQSSYPAMLQLLFVHLLGATGASPQLWPPGLRRDMQRRPHRGYAAQPRRLLQSSLRLLNIRYGDSTVVAFDANLMSGSADPCGATRFNVSSNLALSPLAVSAGNWELFFSAICSRAPPSPPGTLPLDCAGTGMWSVRSGQQYEPGDIGGPVEESAGCKYSVVPVLPGSELRTWDDYAGIVRHGFLLEWAVLGNGASCNATGGWCRYEAGVNTFGCLCPDGRLQPATCGELPS